MEFHRLLPFGFLEGLTLFSTAYETQMRKKEAEDRKNDVGFDPQDSTWSGSAAKVTGPRYFFPQPSLSEIEVILHLNF